MKAEYNAVFEKIAPIRSDEELLSEVLGKAEQMNKNKKSFRKPLVAVCAAALTLCCGITAVGASCEWDFNKLFGDFFGGKADISEIAEKNSAADIETVKKLYDYDFEKQGKLIDKTYHCDGFDLLIKGATATDSSLCIAYDVIFGDDFVYDYSNDEKEYELWHADTQLNIPELASDYYWGVGTSMDSPAISGNTFSYVTVFNVNNVSLTGKKATIDFNRLYRNQKLYDESGCFDGFGEEQSVDCGITIDIDIDFSSSDDTVTAEVGKEAVLQSKDLHEELKLFIERVKVSPYVISVEYSDTGDWIDLREDITITLDDGTILRDIFGTATGGSNGTTTECSENLESPINISMVSSITIGSLEIPLK